MSTRARRAAARLRTEPGQGLTEYLVVLSLLALIATTWASGLGQTIVGTVTSVIAQI